MPKKNKNDILEQELGVITKEKPEVKKPNMYAVVLINDDYTPMEFVIYVLQTIFKKSYEEAKKIMLLVHNEGKGICGIYPLDIAETKANQVIEFSRINQHPLVVDTYRSLLGDSTYSELSFDIRYVAEGSYKATHSAS